MATAKNGTINGNPSSATSDLNKWNFNGYFANEKGEQIETINFGSKVRFYTDYNNFNNDNNNVDVNFHIKPDRIGGKEISILTSNVKDWSLDVNKEGKCFIEFKLKKRKEYPFQLNDGECELCCSVQSDTSFYYIRSNVDKIKIKPCFCNRDFTENELLNIIVELRKDDKTGDKVWVRDKNDKSKYLAGEYVLDAKGNRIQVEITQYDSLKDDLFTKNSSEKMSASEANISKLTKNINLYFKEYEINSCLRKLHFISQVYVETQRFTKSYETTPSQTVSGGEFYRGRGLLHLTHNYNYKECYKNINKSDPTNIQLNEFVPKVANIMSVVCQSSCWYWAKAKCNKYADEDSIINVSAAINRPASVNGDSSKINGFSDREKAYKSLKKIFNYENCDNKK